MKMNSLFLLMFFICALILPSVFLFAQGGPGPDPDTPVPFDGGLSLLVAAGVSYGFKKAYDKRKSDKKIKELNDK